MLPNQTSTMTSTELSTLGASDSRLVDQVRHGDRAAYGDLVRRYEHKLVRTIHRLVGDRQIAEDLAQEAFLKAYDRLGQFDVARRFGPWLFQIGVNGAIDWLRKHRKRRSLSINEGDSAAAAAILTDPDPRSVQELQSEVQYVIAKLPLDFRTVLTLRDIEGFSTSEIAAIIDRSEPTVRWRLLKAREMFREQWERRVRRQQ